MTRVDILHKIASNWGAICDESGCRDEARFALPQTPALLGSSRKVKKGETRGFLTAIVYLSPATESGRTTCPHATAGCAAACLGHNSGWLAMPSGARSRIWKTALRYGAPDLFFALLRSEIAAHERKARRLGLMPVVRLDGSSDLGDAERIAPDFPSTMFYDYTKSLARARRNAGRPIANYHVTFSHSGENTDACRKVLAAGGSVAVVFNARPAVKGRNAAEPLPATWQGAPVIDGDDSDLRFLDAPGSVCGLRFKAKKDRAGLLALAGDFVQPLETAASHARRIA